jgi:hypothetical protein
MQEKRGYYRHRTVPGMLARYIILSIGTTHLSPLCDLCGSKERKRLGERQGFFVSPQPSTIS